MRRFISSDRKDISSDRKDDKNETQTRITKNKNVSEKTDSFLRRFCSVLGVFRGQCGWKGGAITWSRCHISK